MENVLRQFSSRPRLALWACLSLLVGLSLIYLAAMMDRESNWLPDLLDALCTPSTRQGGLATGMAMWAAMVLAMMLPSALPMLTTYLDISEAARAKSLLVVPPFVLAGGYVVVWLAFAAAAGLLQGFAGPVVSSVSGAWGGGMILIIAGFYQFTSLKHACLRKCRQPMPYFLANWTEELGGVLRMGIDLGVACLGCCWAMMLLAFSAGTMNLAWMAVVGALMMLEKLVPESKAIVSGLGIGLAGAGAALVIGG